MKEWAWLIWPLIRLRRPRDLERPITSPDAAQRFQLERPRQNSNYLEGILLCANNAKSTARGTETGETKCQACPDLLFFYGFNLECRNVKDIFHSAISVTILLVLLILYNLYYFIILMHINYSEFVRFAKEWTGFTHRFKLRFYKTVTPTIHVDFPLNIPTAINS